MDNLWKTQKYQVSIDNMENKNIENRVWSAKKLLEKNVKEMKDKRDFLNISIASIEEILSNPKKMMEIIVEMDELIKKDIEKERKERRGRKVKVEREEKKEEREERSVTGTDGADQNNHE